MNVTVFIKFRIESSISTLVNIHNDGKATEELHVVVIGQNRFPPDKNGYPLPGHTTHTKTTLTLKPLIT